MKSPTLNRLPSILVLALTVPPSTAREALPDTRLVENVPYYPADPAVNDPEKRCVVDLQVPVSQPGFATLVWFHGGGLTSGKP